MSSPPSGLTEGSSFRLNRTHSPNFGRCVAVLSERSASWTPPVVTDSALTGDGIAELWGKVLEHRQRLTATGEFAARWRQQQVKWMWSMLEQRVFARLHADRSLKAKLKQIESAVADGRLSPALAVERTPGYWGCDVATVSHINALRDDGLQGHAADFNLSTYAGRKLFTAPEYLRP
jgi:hypothetical protein